ncbi:hypothetical protein CLPU_20c00270 [Gottschalkia purinilytica]|uniref:TVP38/TMEM64 family membrane protein n=1 Tax=Gottschalkia purinilytica TaxID=1503 RepID=A0A0L0W6Z4_GOTPU|nr:TVP38/TMEM64 family protein [Gottschalkia purinilytica]KNF07251.1 hypothetical protein CLPU_20c00270 [Gottschalkia purinilytica]
MEDTKNSEIKNKKKNYLKIGIIIAIITAIILLMRHFGLFEYISIKNIQNLKNWINDFGILGPIVYIGLYVIACIFFLPGLPIGILAGLAFGSLWGAVWASIGSTIGATMAFIVGRYTARDMVEGLIEKNKNLKRIDDGVKQQGWRMLMITRLVPIFPFNVQNYVYGLTDIKLSTYILVSWICMLPGTIAITFMSGALASGEGNTGKTFAYLGAGAVLFVIVSLIPGWLKKKKNIDV